MYKVIKSLLLIALISLYGYAYADTSVSHPDSLGRVFIEATIPDSYPQQLADLVVEKKDMRAYQSGPLSMFPEGSQYVCTADEDGCFLYADYISNAITCLVDMDISSQIPELNADLQFMSHGDAEQFVVQYLAENFEISTEVYKTCAITRSIYESLYEKEREFLENDLATGGKQGATDYFQWDTEDVCYIVYLFQTVDNVPFFGRGETAVANTDVIPYCIDNTGIVAIVFEEGIRYLKIENAWNVSAQLKSADVLAVGDAIQIYAQRVNEMAALAPLNVCDIRLVYGVKDGYAHPFWSFEKKQVTDAFEYTCHDFIDAMSGDLIGDGM